MGDLLADTVNGLQDAAVPTLKENLETFETFIKSKVLKLWKSFKFKKVGCIFLLFQLGSTIDYTGCD